MTRHDKTRQVRHSALLLSKQIQNLCPSHHISAFPPDALPSLQTHNTPPHPPQAKCTQHAQNQACTTHSPAQTHTLNTHPLINQHPHNTPSPARVLPPPAVQPVLSESPQGPCLQQQCCHAPVCFKLTTQANKGEDMDRHMTRHTSAPHSMGVSRHDMANTTQRMLHLLLPQQAP